MRILILLIVFIPACLSDNNSGQAPLLQESDTSFIRFDYNDVLAGSAYRRRATGYQLVVKEDSSAFIPAFSESNNANVHVRLRFDPSVSYQQQMDQLRVILAFANEEYELDSLRGIDIGRLVQTKELAIEITREYLAELGGYGSTATSNYDSIAEFLTQSKLGRDLNKVLQPYGLEVTGTSVEKVFFTDFNHVLINDSTFNMDNNLPERLLDCMTWIKINKIQN